MISKKIRKLAEKLDKSAIKNKIVKRFIFLLTNNSIGFKFPALYGEEIDLMEEKIKSSYHNMKLTQISDIGTRPIEIEIKTNKPETFIDDLNEIFDEVFY